MDMVQALPAARIVATTVGPFLTLHCATAPMARGAAHTVHLDARQLLTASPAGAPGTAPLAAAAAAAATATSMPAAAPVVAAATAPMAVSATAPTPSISSPASTGAPAASGVVAAGDSAAEANSSGAAGQQVVAAAVGECRRSWIVIDRQKKEREEFVQRRHLALRSQSQQAVRCTGLPSLWHCCAVPCMLTPRCYLPTYFLTLEPSFPPQRVSRTFPACGSSCTMMWLFVSSADATRRPDFPHLWGC